MGGGGGNERGGKEGRGQRWCGWWRIEKLKVCLLRLSRVVILYFLHVGVCCMVSAEFCLGSYAMRICNYGLLSQMTLLSMHVSVILISYFGHKPIDLLDALAPYCLITANKPLVWTWWPLFHQAYLPPWPYRDYSSVL